VGRSLAIHQAIQALLLGPGAERRQGGRRKQGFNSQSLRACQSSDWRAVAKDANPGLDRLGLFLGLQG
jgi:hypothetical protein